MRMISVQRILIALTAAAASLFAYGCTQLKQPEPAPYFAETPPPPKQELRWSNGKAPRSFDPAKAASAPETDIARALYEGLTDLDGRTLDPIPAVAERWESSDDKRTWRFFLREDAVWSNGNRVTANDFVRSWNRLTALGQEAAHRELLANFKNLKPPVPTQSPQPAETSQANSNTAPVIPTPSPVAEGVVAESASVLRVDLVHPDKELPKLVAHPIFRPVFDDTVDQKAITNGPFKLSSLSDEGLVLERSDNYWDRESVKLERVSFVAAATPEKALEAYRTGKVDAVTNSEFSPAALKLLEPYDDFRRTAFNALTFYEFNTGRIPLNDRRVRQALALAIDREKLTEGELQGTTRPADTFIPSGPVTERRLTIDITRAENLMEEAGFPEGKGFPKLRLVVARNDAQQRVANSVAEMWRRNLNVETEVIVKEPGDLDQIKLSGEYDIIRRNVVMPTTDETANMISIFGMPEAPAVNLSYPTPTPVADPSAAAPSGPSPEEPQPVPPRSPVPILTNDDALYEVRAIPLFYPTSYFLAKPYVKGFDGNSLDARSLKSVEIDANWRTR
jgi:oligopeptide transport system substrate-binding protein